MPKPSYTEIFNGAVYAKRDSFGGRYHFKFEREGSGAVDTAYDDRLRQWDEAKFKRSMEQAFGDTRAVWDYRKAPDLSKFLSLYMGRPVRLLALIEYTTPSGYPSWRFDFQDLSPYALRVAELEAEGLTTSDAQGIADVEGLQE